MWHLIAGSLWYSRFVLVVSYTICVALLAVNVYSTSADIYAYMWNTSFAFFITIGIVGLSADAEKSTRQTALLPLRPRAVAWADVWYLAAVQLGMVALWCVLIVVDSEPLTPHIVWSMVSHTGLTLGGMTLFLIHTHLKFFDNRLPYRAGWGLAALAVMAFAWLIAAGTLGDVVRFLARYYASPAGAVVAVVAWMSLSMLSVIAYERRASYLV